MPWVDDPSGADVTPPDQLGAAAKTLPAYLAKIGPPAAIAAAAPALLGPLGIADEVGVLPSLARAVVSGGANIGSSKLLPEKYGGDPKASMLSDFAWGAVPEAGSGLAKTGINSFFKGRLARGAAKLAEGGRKSLLDPENLQVQDDLLRAPGEVPFPNQFQESQARTDQANAARQPIVNLIQAARNKYGKPIGDAYNAVPPGTAVDSHGLAQWVDNLHQTMTNSSPRAERYLSQLKDMDPAGAAASPVLNTAQIAQLKKAGYPDAVIKSMLAQNKGPATAAAPATFKDMLAVRQQVNTDLRNTTHGPDRYALGRIQDQLDNRMMDHLPDNMDAMRRQYRGFMGRFGYQQENEIWRATDPREIVERTFKDPRDAYELMSEARSPQEAEQIRSRFIQYVWGDLAGTDKQRAASVRGKLAPYATNPKAAKALLGPQAGQHLSDMASWATYGPNLSQRIQGTPKMRAQLEAGIQNYFLRQHMNPAEATVNGIQSLMIDNPPASDIVGNTPLQLPGGETNRYQSQALTRHAGMGAAGLVMGHLSGGMYQALSAISWLASSDGYAAASKMGAPTRFFINAFKAESPLKAGWWLARGLDSAAQLGGQAVKARREGPIELDNQ